MIASQTVAQGEPPEAQPRTPAGVPAPSFPDGSLIKGSGPEIFLVEGGRRRHVPDPSTFSAMGLNWGKVTTISDQELSLVPLGEPLPRR